MDEFTRNAKYTDWGLQKIVDIRYNHSELTGFMIHSFINFGEKCKPKIQ